MTIPSDARTSQPPRKATGAMAVVMVALVAQHGVEYLFAAVLLTGLILAQAGALAADHGVAPLVLLDEVEKAHPDVFNILLQVMDHGTLTDNNGRKADFRNVVIVMTTNAGASEISRPSIGFTHQDHSSDGMEAIRKLFSPEFRNRLDAIIQFRSLDPAVITRVVDKFIYELEAQLQEKGVTLDVEDSAREWLAEHGFDAKMGARPMARVIQEHIKKPLAEELLFGRLSNGGHLIIRAEDDRLVQDIRQEEEVL